MSYLRMLSRRIRIVLLIATGWLTFHSALLAQGFKQPVPTKDTSTTGTGPYVMAYMLVIVAIALGMLIICRSSNRRDRARPEGFVEQQSLIEKEKKPSPTAKK